MTPSEFSAIRERLDAATPGNWTAKHEAVTTDVGEWGLVAETLNDTDEQRAADARLIANAPTDLRALLDEVERLTKREDVLVKAGLDLMVANKDLTVERDAAFRRGAEAMREAAAQRCEISPIHGAKTTTARKYADAVRALPDPEDK